MKDRVNLYLEYLDLNKEDRPFPFKQVATMLIIASLIIVLFFFATQKISNNRLLNQEEDLRLYLESKENQKKFKTAQQNKKLIDARNELNEKIGSVNKVLKDKNRYNPSLFAQIKNSQPHSVHLTNVEMKEGEVTIEYYTNQIDAPALFAHNLKNKVPHLSLEYKGFKKIIKSEKSKIDDEKTESVEVYEGVIVINLEGGY
ncbi:hypothetical protein ERUR111494_01120 [Erysipelothrix urinaevulpis]|uniref:hypothetical protein n=1 Tax=Erysipelothrix urinaevulpis TaxID=2683717 RepID=UPI001359C4AB|nr:hypothetical protein [Erysipelothrix urinaevulpis]